MVREIHPAQQTAEAMERVAIALREVLAAVELVASGGAPRVAIVNLEGLERVAAEGLAAAQAAGVDFRLVRGNSAGPMLVVGPVRGG